MLEEKLMVLARPFLKDGGSGQALPMERFIKELFVFVSVPRHLVTSRRSGQGTVTLASLFGTWRARGWRNTYSHVTVQLDEVL